MIEKDMTMKKLLKMNGAPCSCGRRHEFKSKIISVSGAVLNIPSIIKECGAKKPYIISDTNTYRVAGNRICRLLNEAELNYSSFIFGEEQLEPDEKTVGTAFMNMNSECDMIIAVGSGVINDTAKILAQHTKLPYIIVATAPSMDGYASMTSSVILGGLKSSLPSRCADVIIGDADILAGAPKKMLLAGIGDMLAKYISICEWRIAALISGEYYCEEVAELIRCALRQITESTDALLCNKPEAISAVFDGLIAGSVAMNYAGVSRPASGAEHYISHIIDMRGVEFNEPVELHGIQCAIGTLISLRLYEKLKGITPNRDLALRYVNSFDLEDWNRRLRTLLGKSAEAMISLEIKEGKYDKQKHRERLEIILDKWDGILNIINEELPSSEYIEALMLRLGLPIDISEIGIDEKLMPDIFRASKDIRDKYVLPRLLWDLGVIDEFATNINQ
jgi:glycerol-1-phosphate dehydrogenase [NAD(P)+]